MVASAAISEEADGHEVNQLDSIPQVEVLGVAANEIATQEDVENATDEGNLLAQADSLGITPLLAKFIHASAHLLSVSIKLLVS